MINNIFDTQTVVLENFESLFIELSAKNCNQHCKHCYIDFPIGKKVKDFISIEKIRKSISELKNENLQCIYLTGAEPMTHPEFNSILRMCLKHSNVCICTNATFINEKKARFLKKVEDEGVNEIIFKLSLDHYDELKNDDLRGRGAFRQVLNAAKSIIKYGFNPIIQVVNYYNEDMKELLNGFKMVFSKIGFDANDKNFQIREYHNKFSDNIFPEKIKNTDFDCKNGRILTEKGIYTCPFLANDHRGWAGNDFINYSKKIRLETPFCTTCAKNNETMFSLNYKKFKA